MPEFTDTQILEAINTAVRESDLEVIPSLITLLALQAPDKARMALDMMKLGIDISRASREKV